MSAWNEPEWLNSTLKCNFCDYVQIISACSFLIVGHSYHCGIVYQHAKYHYYNMSVTFSLSLTNVELIRVHMF